MAKLVLINGAPGSGKSTLAHLLAQDEPLTLALDIDVLKHSLGQWQAALPESGITARRLAIALIREHLGSGRDVIVGQFLARTEFIEELETLAGVHDASFVELVLSVDHDVLLSRLQSRAAHRERAEHLVNATLVRPEDVPGLIHAINHLITRRPTCTVIDANDSPTTTLTSIRKQVDRT
ncbi:ATP-binding protein [Kribbella sp. NBC_01245]|uniref:AAA family ATPase n=1 Tax=Kribbella sp. NBC_01245 TaxID=2903578 RepID=UPI002E2D209F|nr:AAA family ATPase [Kribbella sp. NBC_01245]